MTRLTKKKIVTTLLVVLPLFLAACVEDRNAELLQRIAELEERVASLEPITIQPDVSPNKSGQQARPKSRVNKDDIAFNEIQSIWWDGQKHPVTYKGQLPVYESAVVSSVGPMNGLMFHPDGRIGFSYGMGSSRNMRIAYLNSPEQNNIVDFKYASSRKQEKYPELSEENGYIRFFNGPAAFNADGTCYFSLGSCGGNGMYKVLSNNPTKLQKLYPLPYATSSLQIVPFDPYALYSTSSRGIFRRPLTKTSGDQHTNAWFRADGRGLYMISTLIISPTKLITTVRFRKLSSPNDKDYEVKTLLFDRIANAYWSLSTDALGPMAISWNGKRKIYYNRESKEIREFQIGAPTQ